TQNKVASTSTAIKTQAEIFKGLPIRVFESLNISTNYRASNGSGATFNPSDVLDPGDLKPSSYRDVHSRARRESA
ncbi:MAG TPA: hypothetical protein VF783_16110, partial [Terriglobales bacterium]